MKKLKGIIVPLITPFTEDGTVDKGSIESLVNHVIAGGVQGIFTCSTTGEFPFLSPEQKLKVTKIVMECVKGRVPKAWFLWSLSIHLVIHTFSSLTRLLTAFSRWTAAHVPAAW